MADATIEDILAAAENPAFRRVAVARVLLRQDLLLRHEELERELDAALADDQRFNRKPESPRISQEIVDLEAEIEEAKVAFRFASIGKKAWADLLGKHPPTKEQLKEDPGRPFNPETFPKAAMAASASGPAMTLEQVERLEATLPQASFDMLWIKCIEANAGGGESPKSQAAGMILRRNGGYGTTAASEGSLAQSSSGE